MDDRGPMVAVDVGGTFTDVVLHAEGELTTAKVPTNEDDQSRGVIAGIRSVCETADCPPSAIDRFRHATTVSTNALLEGAGGDCALLTTEGFEDVLEIGRQDRPALYDLDANKSDPLVPPDHRYGVPERASTDGIETPLSESHVATLAADLKRDAGKGSIDSIAVCFLHGYAHPENERRAASLLADRLDVPISVSHEVLGTFREYERTATTVADATLRPVVDAYLDRLTERTREAGLPAPRIMQSNGGIADAASVRERAIATALSGPAAGVVGAALFESNSHDGIISFDMGGTSCDVGLVRDGHVERTTDADVGGRPVRVPMVDVQTVGAGGGSIAWVDEGGALRVGPASAGADPGPACYDRGGEEPTVTDAALALGYLGADTELGGTLSLDPGAAETVLSALAEAAELSDLTAAAQGIVRVATATMTRAIRSVTVERGHDTRDLALVAFGGAGPLFATAIAERLGVDTVLVPRANGVLSAVGLLAADERHDALRTVRRRLPIDQFGDIEQVYSDLADAVRRAASEPGDLGLHRQADLRYAGQSFELTTDAPDELDSATLAERFESAHERVRGYRLPDEPIELVNCRVSGVRPAEPPQIHHEGTDSTSRTTRELTIDGTHRESPVYDRRSLPVGTEHPGPAIYEGGESTVVVTPGWTASVDERGTLVLEVAT